MRIYLMTPSCWDTNWLAVERVCLFVWRYWVLSSWLASGVIEIYLMTSEIDRLHLDCPRRLCSNKSAVIVSWNSSQRERIVRMGVHNLDLLVERLLYGLAWNRHSFSRGGTDLGGRVIDSNETEMLGR